MLRNTYLLIPLLSLTLFAHTFYLFSPENERSAITHDVSFTMMDTTVEILATICAGDTLEGYFETGIYLDTFVGSDGTDSIRVLDLTVQDSIIMFISASVCAGDTFEGYFETGMFMDTFLSVSDCDSVRILNLTIMDSIQTFLTVTSCSGDTVEGYTETGIYQDVFLAANGCDSIRVLDLTITDSIATLIIAEICTGDTLEGYFESGVFIDSFLTQSGCDSVRTLELTVLDSIATLVTAQICTGETMEGYSTTGIFIDTFTTDAGCDSIRTLDLTVLDFTIHELEVTICQGDTFEGHFNTGMFIDTFDISGACDSIRILQLNVFDCDPIIFYDLEACRSYMIDGSDMDYSEFVAAYPNDLTCAAITAGNVHRENPQVNKHSCTPGVNNQVAMCVSSLAGCTYVAGHEASIVIEFTMNQSGPSFAQFTGFEFYEKAPVNYVWIDGPTGPNNYPLRYGIRILKNGTEIFRNENVATGLNWNLESYNFVDNELFRVEGSATFRIELLPYCPIGNGADVSAWDVDELTIFGGCEPAGPIIMSIQGEIATKESQTIRNVTVSMDDNDAFENAKQLVTGADGAFKFDSLQENTPYFLKAYKNDELLNGVNTRDMVEIQKHLLHIKPFTTLHQYVAADVNHSGGITVLDIVELRRALLGQNLEFTNNTSWRFGAIPQDFTIKNPNQLQEVKSFELLTGEVTIADFVGIKIGDLNGDAQTLTGPSILTRSADEFTLIATEKSEENGYSLIEIKAGESITLEGMQFALNTANLNIRQIRSGKLVMDDENYFDTGKGILRFSWSQGMPVEIAKGDILFTMIADKTAAGSVADRIWILSDDLAPEAYATEGDPFTLKLDYNGKQSADAYSFRVEPNPFRTELNVLFSQLAEGQSTIRFFDASGRLLHEISRTYSAGQHAETISPELFNYQGLIICQLVTDGNTYIQKVVQQ